MGTKQSKKIAAQKQSIPIWLPLIVIAGIVLIGVALLSNTRSNSSAPDAAPQATGRPALKADKEKVDLGNVKLGQTVDVSFEITNVGDQPLRFNEKPYIEVAAGC